MQAVSLDFQKVEEKTFYMEILQLINEGRIVDYIHHYFVILKRWIEQVIDHHWLLRTWNERQLDSAYLQTAEHRAASEPVWWGKKPKLQFDQTSSSIYQLVGNTEDNAKWCATVSINKS